MRAIVSAIALLAFFSVGFGQVDPPADPPVERAVIDKALTRAENVAEALAIDNSAALREAQRKVVSAYNRLKTAKIIHKPGEPELLKADEEVGVAAEEYARVRDEVVAADPAVIDARHRAEAADAAVADFLSARQARIDQERAAAVAVARAELDAKRIPEATPAPTPRPPVASDDGGYSPRSGGIGSVHVRGYYRKDGTYVRSHRRSR